MKRKVNILKLISIAVIITMIFSINTYTYPLVRSAGQKLIPLQYKDFYKLETDYFIYYYNKTVDIREFIDETADAINELEGYFGFKPDFKIPIIIYKDFNEFNKKMKLGNKPKVLGSYTAGSLRFVSKEVWNNGETLKENGVVIHEMAHLFLDYYFKKPVPRWFAEGAALLAEKDLRSASWPGEMVLHKDYDEYIKCFDNNKIKSYSTALKLTEDIKEKYGDYKFKELLKELNGGLSFETAFKRVLKINIEDFYNRAILFRGENG